MSLKGKEKAGPVVLDDEEDSDTDFFTARRPTRIRQITPPARRSSPPPSSAIIISSDSDSASEGKKLPRSKKAAKPKSKPVQLADWTKRGVSGSGRNRKRGGTEAKRSGSATDAIIILSSDDEVAPRRDKGKGKEEPKKRFRTSLTPPPEMTQAQLQGIRDIIDRALPIEGPPVDDEAEQSFSGSTAPRDSNGDRQDQIRVTVRMVADPARKEAGASAAAIKAYEKVRIFTCVSRDPVSILLKDLAHRIGKLPEDIVLAHEGQRIVVTRVSWAALGYGDAAELAGYEKPFWERLEDEKRKRRMAHLDDLGGGESSTPQPPGRSPGAGSGAGAERAPSPSPGPTGTTPIAPTQIKLLMRGHWGEVKFAVKVSAAATVTVQQLIAHYCKKVGKEGMEGKVKLSWDGESQESGTTVEELGAESGDMIDMIVPT
ncbi:hypothetical protein JCM24511_01790 [Saitozyma sp. JCM 24511]|nr:hypothetical protein JCM24511_01790 [Saitozyma sp. JCM 24511]